MWILGWYSGSAKELVDRKINSILRDNTVFVFGYIKLLHFFSFVKIDDQGWNCYELGQDKMWW